MEVTEDNVLENSVTPNGEEVEEEVKEIEQYDPTTDQLAQWFALFTHINYAAANPEISIAARLLSRLKIIPVTNPQRCPAMAVGIHNYKHALLYNPAWVAKASFTEFSATLVHEAYHVMLRDIPRFLRRMALFPDENRKSVHSILNVALDAANNDLIRDRMPHLKYDTTGGWVLPANQDLPGKQSSEFYFEVLLERARQNTQDLKNFIKGVLENPDASDAAKSVAEAAQKLLNNNAHDWAKGNIKPGDDGGDPVPMTPDEMEAVAAQMDEEAKMHAKKALKNHQKRHGDLPAPMKSLLADLLSEGEIPWTTFLRQLVAARVSAHKHKTTKKFHRSSFIFAREDEEGEIVDLDFPLPVFPGTEVDRTFVIMWALDTSGSMSTEDITDGLTELQGLIRADPNIHVVVVQCDTRISDVSILNPDEPLEQYIKDVGRTSCGGTRFDPPFALAEYITGKRDVPPVVPDMQPEVMGTLAGYDNVDLIVYHTDGYASAPSRELEPRCPVIWCLTKQNSTVPGGVGSALYGTVIER